MSPGSYAATRPSLLTIRSCGVKTRRRMEAQRAKRESRHQQNMSRGARELSVNGLDDSLEGEGEPWWAYQCVRTVPPVLISPLGCWIWP